MPYADLPGARMYYEELGAGEPILFLHSSFSRGILAFHAQLGAFSAQYRCLLPDLRGHGRTTGADPHWTVPDMAADIPHLLDAVGIESAHVIGYSIGGAAALYGAIRFPDRFRSLITIGAGGRVNEAGRQAADRFEPDAIEARGETQFIEQLKANHREAHKGDWRAFASQTVYNWRRYPDLAPEALVRIQIPAFFLSGEEDESVGRDQLEYLATHVKGARTALIAECGHRPHMVGQQPVLVNDLILKFLADQKQTSR